jgi:signal transduction histidine kinase/CheY-like chemotaxis protein
VAHKGAETIGVTSVIQVKHNALRASGPRTRLFAAWTMLASAFCLGLLVASVVLFDISHITLVIGAAFGSLVSCFAGFLFLREKQVPLAEHNSKVVETSDEKLRLLATMSHEIRTPLNGVVGMINLLQETPLSPEQQNYIATANSSARILLSIVDEALDTAKDQANANHLPQSTHLRPLVENVTELLSARAHAKSIVLSAYVATDVPDLVAVRDRSLRQILFNLVGNAIKFTESGGVGLTIHKKDADLVLDIQDTGIGMTTSECELVFAEYQQANAETAKRYGGTGLGLSITRSLVAGIGGSISVKSKIGKGTTFTVVLPILRQETQSPQQANALAGRRVWLATLDDISGLHIARMIEDEAGTVNRIASNEELKLLLDGKTNFNDCIICTSDHAETLRTWAKDQTAQNATDRPDIWVMLTAEERRSCRDLLQHPFAGYLLKPVRRSSLLSRLADHGSVMLRKTAKNLKAAAQSSSRDKKKHVLVADDNAINVLLVSTMLKNMGHKVTHVNSGKAVLDLVGSGQTFDGLLLDIEMPGLNGYETTAKLRQNELQTGFTRIPIIALTAHKRADELDKCLAAGMDGYLTKPFDQQDLDEALDAFTTRHAA